MILRRRTATLLAALLVLVGLSGASEAQATELGIGTLAPKNSPWGKVFTVWQKKVAEKNVDLTLRFYWNGQQGDEGAMVGKMRAGQLDGAAVTGVGLSKIYKNILALQMPGLWKPGDYKQVWAQLDKVRDALNAELRAAVDKEGFILGGWGDVGIVRVFSMGKAITKPEDLKGTKPYCWTDDDVLPAAYTLLGVTCVPMSVPELLSALSAKRVNVFSVPSLAATQFQWHAHADHIVAHPVSTMVGALVFSKGALGKLTPEQKDVLLKTGEITGKLLTEKIRHEDQKAFEFASSHMTVVTPDAATVALWEGVFTKVRARLAQGVFPAELVKRIEKLAGK